MMWIIFLIGCYLYLEILHFVSRGEFPVRTLLLRLNNKFKILIVFIFILSIICISPLAYLWITYQWIRIGK
jgi:hypothetical protein